jgi:membrane associated rhomboid family serine protease
VLGAYFALYPASVILSVISFIQVKVAAWIFGGRVLVPDHRENFGLFGAAADGGVVAFFAHVSGFVFGVAAARVLTGATRSAPQPR